jgi:hypothetical protein
VQARTHHVRRWAAQLHGAIFRHEIVHVTPRGDDASPGLQAGDDARLAVFGARGQGDYGLAASGPAVCHNQIARLASANASR